MLNAHQRENNPESQANMDFNRPRFNRVCQLVFDRLMRGDRLTVLACANEGISSLPRRILDLREARVSISDRWENGSKLYYMTGQDMTDNCYFLHLSD